VGLAHVALKIGDSLDLLREAKAVLEAHGVPIHGIRDHVVSQSIYCEDPDGNTVELFVDGDPAIWAEDPSTVATTKPLVLISVVAVSLKKTRLPLAAALDDHSAYRG
jgi:catechol 2,3-dioxygenase